MTPRGEWIIIHVGIVGTLDNWRHNYATDGQRLPDRDAAIRHGLNTLGHDDFLVGRVAGDSLLGLAWQHEDRDDPDELADAAEQLGLEAAS